MNDGVGALEVVLWLDMLEEERKDGVIERRIFLGRSVWDTNGVATSFEEVK